MTGGLEGSATYLIGQERLGKMLLSTLMIHCDLAPGNPHAAHWYP